MDAGLRALLSPFLKLISFGKIYHNFASKSFTVNLFLGGPKLKGRPFLETTLYTPPSKLALRNLEL